MAQDIDRPGTVGKTGFRFSSIAETLSYLIAVVAVNRIFHSADPGYLSIHPHPFWAVVILISIRYGFRESLVCSAFAGAAYALFVIFPREGDYYFLTTNLFSDFKDPLLFTFVGGVISGYTEHLIRRTDVLRGRLRERQEEIGSLRQKNRAATEALNRLELRIAGQFTSMLDLVDSLAQAKRMSPEEIKVNLLEVLRRYLHVEQCSFYDVERAQPVKKHSLGGDNGKAASSYTPDQDFILSEPLRSKKVAYLGEFAQQADLDRYRGSSLLAGPLLNASDEVIGLAGIERMPFLEYNPHAFKLFGTILNWWGSALDESIRLEELRSKSVFNEDLGLYNFTYFWGRIIQEFNRAKRFSIPLSLTLIRIDDFEEIPAERQRDLRVSIVRLVTQQVTELEMVSGYKTDAVIAITFPFLMASDAEKKVRQIAAEIDAFNFHPYRDSGIPLSLSWSTADYRIGMASFEEMIGQVENGLEIPEMDPIFEDRSAEVEAAGQHDEALGEEEASSPRIEEGAAQPQVQEEQGQVEKEGESQSRTEERVAHSRASAEPPCELEAGGQGEQVEGEGTRVPPQRHVPRDDEENILATEELVAALRSQAEMDVLIVDELEDGLQRELQEYEQTVLANEEFIAGLRSRMEMDTKLVDDLRGELRNERAQGQQLGEELQAARADIDELTGDLVRERAQGQQLEEELHAARADIDEQRGILQDEQERSRQLGEELQRVQGELGRYRESYRAVDAEGLHEIVNRQHAQLQKLAGYIKRLRAQNQRLTKQQEPLRELATRLVEPHPPARQIGPNDGPKAGPEQV